MQEQPDHRRAWELAAVAEIAELSGLDVGAALADPNCGLLEISQRAQIMAAARGIVRAPYIVSREARAARL